MQGIDRHGRRRRRGSRCGGGCRFSLRGSSRSSSRRFSRWRTARFRLICCGPATSRGQAAADQLGGLFGQSSQQRLNEIRQLAADPVFARFLEQPTDETRAAARAALAKLTIAGPQVIDLWNDAGARTLTLATPPNAGDALPAGPPPSAVGIGALRRFGSSVLSEAVAEVQAAGSRDDSPERDVHRGWLVVRRSGQCAPTADVLNRLVGADATIKVGNQSGDVWTDLTRVVEPPHVDRGDRAPPTAAPRTVCGMSADWRRFAARRGVSGSPFPIPRSWSLRTRFFDGCWWRRWCFSSLARRSAAWCPRGLPRRCSR